jgi:hypothetical protein
MRRPALVALAATALAAFPLQGAEAQDPSAGAAATRNVDVRDNFFVPRRSLTVGRGTILRFVWRRTRNRHNVCANERCSRLTRRSGFVYRRTVRRRTTFICTVHPATMRLRVTVR